MLANNNRGNRWRKQEAKDAFLEPIGLATHTQDVAVFVPGTPVFGSVRIYWEKGRKPWDPTNLQSGLKCLWDHLQCKGYYENDRDVVPHHTDQVLTSERYGETVVLLTGEADALSPGTIRTHPVGSRWTHGNTIYGTTNLIVAAHRPGNVYDLWCYPEHSTEGGYYAHETLAPGVPPGERL